MRVLGNRFSSWPVTQYCGPAGRLSQISAGREAAMSSAWHASCAKAANVDELMAKLTDSELAEIMRWKRPDDVDLGSGRILRYEDAQTEVELAIDRNGAYCDPASDDAIAIGHTDFVWIVQIGSFKVAYVGDLKRSEFTVEEGTRSLQLHGYGLACATKYDCDGYAVGIWSGIEGLWQWSDIVDMESAEVLQIAKRCVYAALNTGSEYATGPHCRKCYGRMHCPAWLLPPEMAQTTLAPLAAGAGGLTSERAAELLLIYQRYTDTARRVEANLKEFAARNGGIKDPKTGKVWLPVMCPGRQSVSIESVRRVFGEQADKAITQGAPYEQYRWTNGARQ